MNLPSHDRPSRPVYLHPAFLLGAIIALGFALRLYRLGFTIMWMDELDIYWHSDPKLNPWNIFNSILRECFQNETNEHMPMQYVLLNVFLRAYRAMGLADNNFLIRLPYAVCGALTVPLLYFVVREFYDRRAALWSSFVVAVSFFHVYQSRDATSYGPMLFFQTLNLFGLLGWVFPQNRTKASFIRRGLCLLIGSMGVLSCHLTSWLFLAAEGVVVAAWFAIAWWTRLRREAPAGSAWLTTPLGPMLILVAATIRFLGVPLRAMTLFRPPGTGEDAKAAEIDWEFMSYAFAHFGWGRGGWRLAALFVVLAVGLWMTFRQGSTRKRHAFHLAMIMVPFLFLFLAPHAVVFPRYLSLCFIPFSVLVARGLQGIAEAPARWKGATAVTSIALVGAIAAWMYGPFRTMFTMTAKLMPVPEITDWVTRNLPPGGAYVWQSGYNLREIPKAYPIPDRQPAYATLNSGSIRAPEAAATWGPVARDLFRRFPLAVLLATDFPEPPLDAHWRWLGTDFANRTSVVNRALAQLHQWGFSHSGILDPANDQIYLYWNRPEDLVRRAASEGKTLAGWVDGPGWQFLQTREHLLLAAIPRAADYRVWNISPSPVQARLVIRAAAQEEGALRVGRDGADEANTLTAGFARSNGMTLEVGPVTLDPGEQVLQLRQVPSDRMALLVFSLEIQPAAAAESVSLPKE